MGDRFMDNQQSPGYPYGMHGDEVPRQQHPAGSQGQNNNGSQSYRQYSGARQNGGGNAYNGYGRQQGPNGYAGGGNNPGQPGYGANGYNGYGQPNPNGMSPEAEAQAAAMARIKAQKEAQAKAKAEEARRKKKRKRMTRLAVLAVIVGAVLGWYFLYYTKTPSYAVKLIQKSINQHDAVTFQEHVAMPDVLSKGFSAVREAEWDSGVTDAYTEEDKPEYTKHIEQVIMNGVMTGDWTDSYKKTNPDKALHVDWGSLTLKDVSSDKEHGDEALVNIRLDNPDVGTDTLVLRMKKNPKGDWQLVEIMNLKWYYTKILQRTVKDKKKTGDPIIDKAQQTFEDMKKTPVGPIYEIIKEKILEEDSSKSQGETQNGKQGSQQEQKPSANGGTPSAEEQQQALQKILNHPVFGKLAGLLVEHQDEIMAKLDELSKAVDSGQADAALQEQINKYQNELVRLGKIFDFLTKFM
jgi:hypothetical protein